MDTVPQIISTKDLSYLADMFNWNYNAFKQIHHYVGEVQDNSVKELLEGIENMHYNHLLYIISILKGESQSFDDDEVEFEEDGNNEGQ